MSMNLLAKGDFPPFLIVIILVAFFGLIVLGVILVLFGGKKLPELARGLGKAQAEYNKAKEAVEGAADEAQETVEGAADEIKEAVEGAADEVAEAVEGAAEDAAEAVDEIEENHNEMKTATTCQGQEA